MAATVEYGSMIFKGMSSGKSYSVDIYLSDVDGGLVRFDAGAGASASSPDFMTFPENVILTDYAQVTGNADTTKLRLVANGKPTSQVLRYAMHLTTLATRPKLSVGFQTNTRVAAIQLA